MPDSLRRILVRLVPYGLLLVVGGAVALYVSGAFDAVRAKGEIVLANRGALALLAGAALAAWVGFHLRLRRTATFQFSRVADAARTRRGWVGWLGSLPRVLRVVALALLAIALARPQTFRKETIEVEGIDIMLVLDLSKSMEEKDLRRDRLDAAQRTIRKFLKGRKNDRIGLVVFAKETMLQAPLTLDYRALDRIVADLQIGDIEPMGTAIGDGLALGLASLRRSDAKSKVLILLTDGESNVVNEFDPDSAKDLARALGIPVFTVLMGRESSGRPDFDLFGRQPHGVDPALLKRIAGETGGRYFNASDTEALERGFEEVRATLETTKRKEIGKVYGELFPELVTPALGLLLLEVLLSLTRFRRFP